MSEVQYDPKEASKMNKVLIALRDAFKFADESLEKKFKAIEASELIDDLLRKNRVPFMNFIGLRDRRLPIPNISMRQAYRQEFDGLIIIVQDSDNLTDIIMGNERGTESIWELYDYVFDLIILAMTEFQDELGFKVRFKEQEAEAKLTTLTRQNTVKLAVEIPITIVMERFTKNIDLI